MKDHLVRTHEKKQRDRSAVHPWRLISAFVFHCLDNIISFMSIPKDQAIPCEPRHEKTNVLVSDLVQHKPGCTATEDG